MGAGIGPAHDGAGVLPHPGPQLPVRLGLRDGRPQPGAQVVGDHHVEQRVEGVLARVADDVAHRPALVGGVGGTERLVDDQVLPPGQGADDAGLLRLRRGVEPGAARRGPTASGCARGRAGRTSRRQPGRASRMAPWANDSRSFMVWGSVSATTVAPRAAAAVDAASWCSSPPGFMRRHPEHVPVGRTVGEQRQRGHELDLVLAEPVEAPGHDELEGGARVAATAPRTAPRAPGAGARTRRHGHAVAVVVGGGLRGGEARAPPRSSDAVQGRGHGGAPPRRWPRRRRRRRP